MRRIAAYTLLEVLVATTLLTIAVSAAAILAMATVAQEDRNNRISRCLNFHEQAARLYQLGLEPATITAILPPEPGIEANQPVFTAQSLGITNLGTVQSAESTLEFSVDDATRTSTLVVIRPTLR